MNHNNLKHKNNDRVYRENEVNHNDWPTYRERINKVLLEDDYVTEDKLLSVHFLDFQGRESISGDEFIVKVLGYLFQNVYRGRKMEKILSDEYKDTKSLIGLLKKYHENEDHSIDNVLRHVA